MMNDNFKWTDDLVKEYAAKLLSDRVQLAAINDCAAAPVPIPIHFEQFKKSKSIKEEQPKEWEILRWNHPKYDQGVDHCIEIATTLLKYVPGLMEPLIDKFKQLKNSPNPTPQRVT